MPICRKNLGAALVLAALLAGIAPSQEVGGEKKTSPESADGIAIRPGKRQEANPNFKRLPTLADVFADRNARIGRLSLSNLGEGRSRLVYGLTGSEEVALDEDLGLKAAPASFAEECLRNDIKRAVPDASNIAFVDDIRVRTTEKTVTATKTRRLEVEALTASIDAIEAVIAKMLATPKTILMTEVWLIYCAELPAEAKGLPTDRAAVMNQEQFDTLFAAVSNAAGCTVVQAPKLSVYVGQRANIVVQNQTPYIRDYEIEQLGDTMVVDPVIDVVKDGVILDAAFNPASGGKGLLAEIGIVVSTVESPIRSFETTIQGEKVTIQLPEIHTSRWNSKGLVLADGEVGFVVAGLRWRRPDSKDKEAKPLLVFCRVAPMAAPARRAPADVMGFDGVQSLVFAKTAIAESFSVGENVAVERDGKAVGNGAVTFVEGAFLMIKLDSGDAKLGDVIR